MSLYKILAAVTKYQSAGTMNTQFIQWLHEIKVVKVAPACVWLRDSGSVYIILSVYL